MKNKLDMKSCKLQWNTIMLHFAFLIDKNKAHGPQDSSAKHIIHSNLKRSSMIKTLN